MVPQNNKIIKNNTTNITFSKTIENYNWNEIAEKINNATENEVLAALNSEKLNENDLMALLSPAAALHLEQMAAKSKEITQRRFGKTIQLYIPLYLSNYCTNNCVYCGFNTTNKIKRIKLNDDEILQELTVIKKMGYEHILLVTGEAESKAGMDYLLNAIKIIKPHFASISAEIQPLEMEDYKKLIAYGLNTVYIYQETYSKKNYNKYHLKGRKTDFEYRLATPERLGNSGIHRIGLGALLGLEQWQVEAFFIGLHLQFLQKYFWRTKYSISFPRIRPHTGDFQPNFPISDKELAQLIWAFRIFDEDVELALSTRESKNFRNSMLSLGITSMSAGSKTEPGGYSTNINELEQFTINDNRTAFELEQEINKQGYYAVWKDWDKFLV
jgi:2-iminoacetate synthase